MSIDPGFIGPGQDFGDTSAGVTTSGDPETDFKTAVMQALIAKGIDITLVDPGQLDSLMQMLWSTQRLQDLFQLENDPAAAGFPDITVTASELRSAISKELFDPTTSSSSSAVTAGLSLLEQQNLRLDQAQQEFLVTGAGGSSDVRQIIIDVAGSLGVDPALALAIAQQESGMNPNAVGDGGDSVGLFQLNIHGEGAGMGDARYDPRTNAIRALTEVAAVAAQHPEWSPGQIAAAAQRPYDPVGYAAAVDSLYGPIRAGKLPSVSSKTSTLRQLYPEAVSAFRSQYGRDPSPAELQGLVGLNSDQIREALRSRQSHIPGLSFGAYGDLRSVADKKSNELFGHGVTDGMLAELANQGKTSSVAVEFWLSQMDIKGKMDPKTYQSIWQANQPHMAGVYNQPNEFDPRIAMEQARRAKEKGIKIPPPSSDKAFQHGPGDRTGDLGQPGEGGGGGGSSLMAS